MGLVEQIAEDARAADAATATGALGRDDRFWRSFAYCFRIKGPTVDALFPLVLNPERYQLSLPFAVEVTPTQEGGIFVEKKGIVIGKLLLEGHTGFQPILNDAETGSPRPTVPLSGQAHFLRLQRLCFEAYSTICKDPQIGPRTRMEFHSFKDSEHVIIEPDPGGFVLNRTKQDRVLYRYQISAHVLGKIEAIPVPAAEDAPVINQLRNATVALESGVADIQGGILDLDGVGEVREAFAAYETVVGAKAQIVDQVSSSVLAATQQTTLIDVTAGIPSDLTRITGAVTEFLRGTRRTISLPYEVISQMQTALDGVILAVEEAANLPSDAVQILRKMDDALDAIGTYPERFVEPFQLAAERFLAQVGGPSAAPEADLDVAAGSSVTQPQQLQTTALRPGDLARVEGGVYRARRSFPRYEGYREARVRQGDNLARIAGRELNDARRWPDLALANGLKDPYISDEGLPGTLRFGDPILIPTEERQGDTGQVRSKGDPRARASQLEAVLGRDLALAQVGSGRQFDLVIDTAGGSIDFKTVAGADNLSEAVSFILSVDQGDDVLYQGLGIERIIGRRGTLDRIVEAELRITEGVLRDPRVTRVQSVRFTVEPPGDTIAVELDAILIDNSQARVIGRVIS